jgi:hypothetical protein
MSPLRNLYFSLVPFTTIYSTIIGIDAGCIANKITPAGDGMESYANLIGYTTLGFITGVTYPISFPLFGSYVLYKLGK